MGGVGYEGQLLSVRNEFPFESERAIPLTPYFSFDSPSILLRWLDRGPGKELSLPECSREQLEKERITYLSAEQRLK